METKSFESNVNKTIKKYIDEGLNENQILNKLTDNLYNVFQGSENDNMYGHRKSYVDDLKNVELDAELVKKNIKEGISVEKNLMNSVSKALQSENSNIENSDSDKKHKLLDETTEREKILAILKLEEDSYAEKMLKDGRSTIRSIDNKIREQRLDLENKIDESRDNLLADDEFIDKGMSKEVLHKLVEKEPFDKDFLKYSENELQSMNEEDKEELQDALGLVKQEDSFDLEPEYGSGNSLNIIFNQIRR